jgi:putative DNA primase/helicase
MFEAPNAVTPSLAATVAHCVPRHLNLIPVDNKKALAKWKAYQGTMVTDAELSEWMTAGCLGRRVHSFGVVTGLISEIVVVDSDSKDGEDWCQSNLPHTPWMVKTCKGVHRYYRHPGGSVSNRCHHGEPRLDVKGDVNRTGFVGGRIR